MRVRELGLPLQPLAAATALLDAQPRAIDLGRAGDRHFLLMAGIGFDAAVTAEVRGPREAPPGRLRLCLPRPRSGAALPRHAHAHRRGWQGPAHQRPDGCGGQHQLYGGFIKLTGRASIDDGLLDVCIIKGNTLRGVPLRILSILLRRATLDPKIEYHRAHIVQIETRQPMPVQVDGDHIGSTPMTFECVPGALRALLPPMLSADLLHAEHTPPRRAWRRMLGWVGRRPPSAPEPREEVRRYQQ